MTDLANLLEITTPPSGPRWADYPDMAWERDSFAVVACRDGHGCVLWTGGPHVAFEISQCSNQLGDIGLDDAPDGISVWVGKYLWHPGGYESPQDGDTEAKGVFRAPTPEEWKAVMASECPWNDADWRKPPTDEEKTP